VQQKTWRAMILSSGSSSLPVVVLLLTAHALAQDPSSRAPQAYTKSAENELVRVTRVHYARHERAHREVFARVQRSGGIGPRGPRHTLRERKRSAVHLWLIGRCVLYLVHGRSNWERSRRTRPYSRSVVRQATD
jgi:hypothetical protein